MTIKIALAGNPNSGKTTVFNLLTGANQYVGNWPGVTVEKKDGLLKWNKDVTVQDLPGIYSLSPYSPEEIVSRRYLVEDRPDAIINVVDATNLERNLYLTLQLAELGIPVVIALNMTDLAEKKKQKVDVDVLSRHLHCPVIEASALKGTGVKEAAEEAVRLAKAQHFETPPCVFSGSTEHALAHIEDMLAHVLEDDEHREHSEGSHHIHHHHDGSLAAEIRREQLRWHAIKLFERDVEVTGHLALDAEAVKRMEAYIQECEAHQEEDAEAIIIRERYDYIEQLLKEAVLKKGSSESTSSKLDAILTHRWLGLPIFAAVMFVVYYISISTVGTMMTDWTNDVLFGEVIPPAVSGWLQSIGCAEWLIALIVDGIIAGVGAVLGFLPQMVVLFLCLSLLEECGYMVRIAYLLDRLFRRFGLSGKSFIPLLVGTGCSVPAIMGSRAIERECDRRMAVMTTSFIPCGAKLPIIAMIAGALFNDSAWVAASCYFIGVAAVLLSGLMLKKTRPFASDAAPFVMELPAYHLPRANNVGRTVWDRSWAFVKKAGTIILLSSLVIWLLSNFNWKFQMVSMEASMLATIGSVLAPVFAPLGFGDWQATVATLTGLTAKEAVVSTMGVLYGGVEVATEAGSEIWAALADVYTPLAGYSFLLFNLLCIPCFASVGAIRREMASAKWTWGALAYEMGFAYGVSLCVYQLGMLFTGHGFGPATAAAFLVLAGFLYMLFRKNKYAAKYRNAQA